MVALNQPLRFDVHIALTHSAFRKEIRGNLWEKFIAKII